MYNPSLSALVVFIYLYDLQGGEGDGSVGGTSVSSKRECVFK